jgi:two-component system, cell cycle sensor histidine kinase and response regulator CckA
MMLAMWATEQWAAFTLGAGVAIALLVLAWVIITSRHKTPPTRFRLDQAAANSLMDHLPQRVFYKDIDSVYLSCNQNYAEDLDITPEEIVGKTDFDFYPADLAEKYRTDDQWIMESGQTEELEEAYVRADVEQIVQMIKTPVFDKKGNVRGILGIFADVTEQRKAQHDYQVLFDQMITGFALHEMIFDESGKPVDYRFLTVNPAFEELTGLKAADLIGKTALETMPNTEPYWIEMFGNVVLTGQPSHYENYSQALGRHNEVISYRPTKGQFACTFVDITDRREAEQELEQSEQQLAEAQALAHLGSWELDVATNALTGSEETRQLLGTAGPVEYDYISGRIHPDDRDRHREFLGGLLSGTLPTPAIIEYRILHPDGNYRWLQGRSERRRDDTDKITHLFGTIQDITESRTAQDELRTSRAFLQSVLDASPDVIIVVSPQREIIRGNLAAYELAGERSLIGMNCRELWDEDADDTTPCPVDQVIETKAPVRAIQDLTDAQGNRQVIDVSAAPILDTEGNVTNVVAIVSDITDRTELESKLRQAHKMEAIGQLAGGIAHDFNNILTAVMGYADLLSFDLPEGTIDSEHAQSITQACRRAVGLTGQLLSFARKGDYHEVATDVHEVIEEVHQLLRHSVDRRIKIVTDFHASSSVIMTDPSQLQNALLNLGVNARDAMPDGGTLTFATRDVLLTEADRERTPYEIGIGAHVEIRVTDTGEGMDSATQDKIFEPFFTTKEVGKGTGLGLAAVYGFVKNHKGSIEVTSAPGHGTTFALLVPTSSTNATEDKREPREEVAIVHGHGRVLVIDDEEDVRTFTKAALELVGYEVACCSNGAQGLEYYREHQQDIDLILLDLIMPELSGEDAFHAIRNINPQANILIATGYADTAAVRPILEAGASGFIRKPFQISDLSQAVANAMND